MSFLKDKIKSFFDFDFGKKKQDKQTVVHEEIKLTDLTVSDEAREERDSLQYGKDQKNGDKGFNQKKSGEDKKQRDDDQDSLGYTQNQWDQQTLNFQLQDRMLDCLEDEKHAQSYRQSIKQNTQIRNRSSFQSMRLSNRWTVSQGVENQGRLQQKAVGSNQVNGQQKSTQKKRKNRFEKYMKRDSSNNLQQENKSINPFIAQQSKQQKRKTKNNYQSDIFDEILFEHGVDKQHSEQYKKLKEINPYISMNSYMDQVFSVSKQEEKNGQVSQQNFKKQVKQVEDLNIINKMQKKQSEISQASLQIQDQIKNNLKIEIQNEINIQQNYNDQPKEPSKPQSHIYEEIDLSKNQNLIQQKTNQVQPLNNNFQQLNRQKENNEEKKYRILTPPTKKKYVIDLPQNYKFEQEKQKINNFSPNVEVLKYQSITTQETESNELRNRQNTMKSQNQIKSNPRSPFSKSPIIYDPYSPKKSSQDIYSPALIPKKYQQSPGDKNSAPKIIFNYISVGNKNQNLGSQKQISNFIVNKYDKQNSPNKKMQSVRIHYKQAQPQQRIPIFLQKVCRLNSVYPNLHRQNHPLQQQKILKQLQNLLNSTKSALMVIQLLYKKLLLLKTHIKQFYQKIRKSLKLNNQINDNIKNHQILQTQRIKYQNQISDYFINSNWQNYKIEEIQYIRPHQKFIKRYLNSHNFEQGLVNFNTILNHYLNSYHVDLKTFQGKQRYVRIRQKINLIQRNLKIMSQDLYTFWIYECTYPFVYYEYLGFLKQVNSNITTQKIDEILAKLIYGEQIGDLVSVSIIGRKIHEKIQIISKGR